MTLLKGQGHRVVYMDEDQLFVVIVQSLRIVGNIAAERSPTLLLDIAIQMARRPNADHCIDSHF